MNLQAKGTFEIRSWDERVLQENLGEPRLAQATVRQTFAGDIDGEGYVEYIMVYLDDGGASFVGLQRVIGSLAGRIGSFVLETSGIYREGTANARWTVVPGSGTGDLHGLTGSGEYIAPRGRVAQVTLNYAFR